ncbi:MAG: hypothetical protein JXR88_04540 [Clostridia bacterium]|nr:hypothetical protein [Clostridia bacterium]
MKINKIKGFNDFIVEIHKIGFCFSGNNGEGIFSLEDYYVNEIEFHTGDLALDPWQWRHRAVEEHEDIFYGKVFMNKSGWITKSWMLDLIHVRRKGMTAEALYDEGLMSVLDKSVYDYIEIHKRASFVEIQSHFGKENKSKVEKSLLNLQMNLLISMCGETRKISKEGLPYGWPVTVFCTVDSKFEAYTRVDEDEIEDSYKKLRAQILSLNPEATEKKISKFLKRMI